jgi:hypothetical protein
MDEIYLVYWNYGSELQWSGFSTFPASLLRSYLRNPYYNASTGSNRRFLIHQMDLSNHRLRGILHLKCCDICFSWHILCLLLYYKSRRARSKSETNKKSRPLQSCRILALPGTWWFCNWLPKPWNASCHPSDRCFDISRLNLHCTARLCFKQYG